MNSVPARPSERLFFEKTTPRWNECIGWHPAWDRESGIGKGTSQEDETATRSVGVFGNITIVNGY